MEMLCPILGRPTPVRFTGFQSGPWRIVQCTETGFVFLADPPSYEQLQVEHAWEVTSAAESSAAGTQNRGCQSFRWRQPV